MMDSYEGVVRRLKEYRRKTSLKQSEMSQKLNITQSHYSKIERREKIISGESLMCMQKNGMDIDYIVTGLLVPDTVLNELYSQCPVTCRCAYMQLMIIYVSIALQKMNLSENHCYTRELEILRFYSIKKIDANKDTVWNVIRRISGLTQEQIAKELDIDIKSYREIEKEKVMPNVEILSVLYEKYGYYPSLVLKIERNFLFSLNRIWNKLPMEIQVQIRELLEKDLRYITA